MCGDGLSLCNEDNFCCKEVNGSYSCCVGAKGVCCMDKSSCCPDDFSCKMQDYQLRCINENTGIGMDPHTRHQAVKNLEVVVCPDGKSACNDGQTCCLLEGDVYGCCQFTDAVCCSDMKHCCPKNNVCDITHNLCLNSTNIT